jgi:hypothetical protein
VCGRCKKTKTQVPWLSRCMREGKTGSAFIMGHAGGQGARMRCADIPAGSDNLGRHGEASVHRQDRLRPSTMKLLQYEDLLVVPLASHPKINLLYVEYLGVLLGKTPKKIEWNEQNEEGILSFSQNDSSSLFLSPYQYLKPDSLTLVPILTNSDKFPY